MPPPPQAATVAEIPPTRLSRGLVTLVLPAKDEEQGIGPTLRSLPLSTLEAMGFRTEVVVLDGASRDRTAAIARARGAEVITEPARGKGYALRSAVGRFRGDYVVMIDADSTYAPDAIPLVVEALAWGEADVVMGSRRRGQIAPGAMSPINRLGNRLLSLAASVLYLHPCSDLCTGLWGFRSDVLRALPLRARGFELEAELFALSVRSGLAVTEVPVDYLPRRGETKLGKVLDGVRIGLCLVRTRVALRRVARLRTRTGRIEHPMAGTWGSP